MDDRNGPRKLAAMAPVASGISSVKRLLARGGGTGLAFGTCDFQPGTIDMRVDDPEAFIVLDGALSATTDDATIDVRAGEALWMPAGCTVQIAVREPARVVYIIREAD